MKEKNIYKIEINNFLLKCAYCNNQEIFTEKKDSNFCEYCNEITDGWSDKLELLIDMAKDEYDAALQELKDQKKLKQFDNLLKNISNIKIGIK
jgi:hypothetical protein